MIFRSGVFSRKQGLSQDAFTTHWINVHGELASHLPDLHRYLQNHIDERMFEREPFPAHRIDGVSQLWFDDIAAMERAEDSPEYAACKVDIPNFQGEITILVLDSVLAVGGDDAAAHRAARLPGSKLFWFATAKKGVELDAIGAHWRARTEADLAGSSADRPLRCVINLVIDHSHPVSAGVPQGQLPADTLGEMWFATPAALQAWLRSDAGHRIVYENPLLDVLAVYAGHEVPIVG